MNSITSELFGHTRGSFSGAVNKRVGLVEHANGGTLILDEILNLPPHAQQLLLDFTQFGTYRPLGHRAAEPLRAEVRIIAATNGDMEQAVAEGRFLEDLYYRLAAATVRLPPLRERRLDIVPIAAMVLSRIDPSRILASPATDWRGNIRQLEADSKSRTAIWREVMND